MKLVRCEWPSLVVEWLRSELEERGIPGHTYAHTILSLLHHHYCPHPHPTTPPPPTKRPQKSPLSHHHYYHLDPDLFSEAHPDADLPDLSAFTQQQRGTSRRARKRYKIRQKQRVLTSEQLQKVAALQCLMSAADERYDLENLVEELCVRLKTAREEELEGTDAKPGKKSSNKTSSTSTGQPFGASTSEESGNDTDGYNSSTPEERAEKYYAAFPPLSAACGKSKSSIGEKWKAVTSKRCVCGKERAKVMPADDDKPHPCQSRSHRREERKREKKEKRERKENWESKDGGGGGRRKDEGSVGHSADKKTKRSSIPFTWHSLVKNKGSCSADRYDTDSASDVERNVERRKKKPYSALNDEDIGEGYIGDTSSRESSEDRDKNEVFTFKRDDHAEKGKGEGSGGRGNGSQHRGRAMGGEEEWEKAVDLMPEEDTEVIWLGSRLFERGSTSGGTSSGSNSDGGAPEDEVLYRQNMDESVEELQRRISNTVAQVWGRDAADPLAPPTREECVWEPPPSHSADVNNVNQVWGCHSLSSGLPFVENMYKNLERIESKSSLVLHQLETPTIEQVWSEQQQKCALQPPNNTIDVGQSQYEGKFPEINISAASVKAFAELCSDVSKTFWADCNANQIPGSGFSITEGEEQSCRDFEAATNLKNDCKDNEGLESILGDSFNNLKLENLWENNVGLESSYSTSEFELGIDQVNICENVSRENSTKLRKGDALDQKNMEEFVDDVCKSIDSQPSVEAQDPSLPCPVPCGPSGRHATLNHTETSGFTAVIPRGRSAEPPSNDNTLDPPTNTLLLSLGNVAGQAANYDASAPIQEEENLLTSPRTHFRPIRQESLEGASADQYEDGTMFMVNSGHPDLPFQRTSSGALFLESDLLEGSPKKYMVYRQHQAPQPPTVGPDEGDSEAHNKKEKVPKTALIPKFKVVNNEKFCQTEDKEEGRSAVACWLLAKCPSEPKDTDHHIVFSENEEEPDVFEFQQQDFPVSTTKKLANIWKENYCQDGSDPQLWSLANVSKVSGDLDEKKAWQSIASLWHQKEETPAIWSTEYMKMSNPDSWKAKSEAIMIPSSLASLWNEGHPSVQATPSLGVPSFSNLRSLWSEQDGRELAHVPKEEARPDAENVSSMTNLQSSISGLLGERDPWKVAEGLETLENPGNWDRLWLDESVQEDPWAKPPPPAKDCSSSKGSIEWSSGDAPVLPLVLRHEVDQEAEELLDAVDAERNKPVSCDLELLVGVRNESQVLKTLNRQRIGGYEDDDNDHDNNDDEDDREKLCEKEGQEDLDDLAPGWQLEGFEWGRESRPKLDDDDEECGEAADDDVDEYEGNEYIVYEGEDGQSYTIPIEYLDDQLYDQIFGSLEADRPIGGSLPDLPTGDQVSIRFSTDLENEWKKSGIPYKVQLPRKGRPGRWIPPSRRPCTFFMEGNCRRNDCKFSHDLASITCRFWEEGSCLKGITCPFLHGYPLRRKRNKSEGMRCDVDRQDLSSVFEIDSEADFPALSSSCESKHGVVVSVQNFQRSGPGFKSQPEKEKRLSRNCAVHQLRPRREEKPFTDSSPTLQWQTLEAASQDERLYVGSSGHTTHGRRKKKKFIAITKNIIGEVKSKETERLLRKKAAQRRERRRRHTDRGPDTSLNVGNSGSTGHAAPIEVSKPSAKIVERHCSRVYSTEDGSLSDY